MTKLSTEEIEKAVVGFGFTFNHQLHKEYELEKISEHLENYDYDEFDEQGLFDAMSYSELNVCDKCKEIDKSDDLVWLTEEPQDDKEEKLFAYILANHNLQAVCECCLSKLAEEM